MMPAACCFLRGFAWFCVILRDLACESKGVNLNESVRKERSKQTEKATLGSCSCLLQRPVPGRSSLSP